MGEADPSGSQGNGHDDIELQNAQSPANVSNTNNINDNPPKSSNLQSFFVVAAGFVVQSMTCSIVFSFGVYQALYEEMAKQPNTPFTGSSTALIDLIGTLAIALMTMAGPFATLWAKLYSPQLIISAGGVVFGLAFILASFSQHLWQFALTQGVLAGLGVCMSYVPTTSVAPTWFDKRRGLAVGVIIAGTGVGGMIWPPVQRALISRVGFRNAMRVSGCISALMVSIAGYQLRWEPRFAERIRLETQSIRGQKAAWLRNITVVDLQVAKSKRFILQATGNFLQAAGYSIPLLFYAAYAQSRGYSADMAANFITLSNASNFVSRIIIGYAADRLGRLNALFATTVMTAIAILGFWLPSTFCDKDSSCRIRADVLFIVFTIFYGAFGSAYVSLFPAALMELFGPQHFTSVNGALYLVRGSGALLGTPLTGLLIRRSTALTSSKDYERAVIAVGVLMCAAGAASLWVRLEATVGSKWKWKA